MFVCPVWKWIARCAKTTTTTTWSICSHLLWLWLLIWCFHLSLVVSYYVDHKVKLKTKPHLRKRCLFSPGSKLFGSFGSSHTSHGVKFPLHIWPFLWPLTEQWASALQHSASIRYHLTPPSATLITECQAGSLWYDPASGLPLPLDHWEFVVLNILTTLFYCHTTQQCPLQWHAFDQLHKLSL